MEIEKAQPKMSRRPQKWYRSRSRAAAAIERRTAVDAQARLEVALKLQHEENQKLQKELARGGARQTAEERVAKLNELLTACSRRMRSRPGNCQASAARRTKKKAPSMTSIHGPFGSRGKRFSK